MIDASAPFVAAVFVLAGVVKGVIGLGLPTISLGLLAIVMTPVEAVALLLLPSFVTNVWQMAAGPSLVGVIRRLWPMMLAVCLGTWSGIGLMTKETAPYGAMLLGASLIVYAILGLTAFRITVRPTSEAWLGPLVGAITGLVTAVTGVFVIPAVPYLQAIGLEKDDLVQALGLSFTVSTVALAVNVGFAGALNVSLFGSSLAALVAACLGMWGGQFLRSRMAPQTFRKWFFTALLVLGLYLFAKSWLIS